MTEGWSIAVWMTVLIASVYMCVDYFILRQRRLNREWFERKIMESNTVDELIDLRQEAPSKDLIAMIDRKLTRITK